MTQAVIDGVVVRQTIRHDTIRTSQPKRQKAGRTGRQAVSYADRQADGQTVSRLHRYMSLYDTERRILRRHSVNWTITSGGYTTLTDRFINKDQQLQLPCVPVKVMTGNSHP